MQPVSCQPALTVQQGQSQAQLQRCMCMMSDYECLQVSLLTPRGWTSNLTPMKEAKTETGASGRIPVLMMESAWSGAHCHARQQMLPSTQRRTDNSGPVSRLGSLAAPDGLSSLCSESNAMHVQGNAACTHCMYHACGMTCQLVAGPHVPYSFEAVRDTHLPIRSIAPKTCHAAPLPPGGPPLRKALHRSWSPERHTS